MKLDEIVKAILCSEYTTVTDEELVNTVKFIIQDNICRNPKTLLKIGKVVLDAVKYEKA